MLGIENLLKRKKRFDILFSLFVRFKKMAVRLGRLKKSDEMSVSSLFF